MRMCPACGAKDFDLTPPPISVTPTPLPTQQTGHQTIASASASAPSFNAHSGTTSSASLVPATLGARFLAYMLDALILTILTAIPVTIGYLISLPSRNQDFHFTTTLGVLAAYVIPFVYFTVMPASFHQATYGKKAMGLRLVTVQGERLSKAQAFVRVLLTMVIPIAGLVAISISFGGMALGYKEEMAASIGVAWLLALPFILFGPYLTVFFNPLKQTLYDMIVKTIVVKA